MTKVSKLSSKSYEAIIYWVFSVLNTTGWCQELDGAPDPLLHLGVGGGVLDGRSVPLLPIPEQPKVLGLCLAKVGFRQISAEKNQFLSHVGLKTGLGGIAGPQSGLCCPPGKNTVLGIILHHDDIQGLHNLLSSVPDDHLELDHL